MRRWKCLLLIALVSPAALAQTDEQTQDHEEQDRRYYERYFQEEKKKEEVRPPSPDRAARVAAFLARADELIRDKNYRSATGDAYRVQTDDPRVDPKVAVALLDAFRDFFDGYWPDGVELVPYDKESRAFLFYSFYKFNQLFFEDKRFNVNRPRGHYRASFDVITIYTDPGGGPSLAETLIHEAAHQLIDQRLFAGRGWAPFWLAEGMASYFGYTLLDKEMQFRPGVIGGKAVALVRGGRHEPGDEARGRLQEFKKALKSMAKDGFSPIEEVLSIEDPAVFYGENAHVHYTASWLLVHFLMHADEGAHRAALVRWLALEAEGSAGTTALFGETGLDSQELDAAVVAYAKRLRVR